MLTVELVYDPDCPNVQGAREQLRLALAEAGLPLQWQEWNRADPEAPSYARGYGSPTFLVNGRDVAGASLAEGANNCRVYPDAQGRLGRVPTVAMLAAALSRTKEETPRAKGGPSSRKGWRAMLAVLPAAGAALLPWGTCPACWPAYVGLLSALGLGVIDYTSYLLPLTLAFLAIALVPLGYRAKAGDYRPLALGVVAVLAVVVSKFVFSSETGAWAGTGLLVAASLWNSRPPTKNRGGSCAACATQT
jgi:hypothetical protein